MSIEPGTVVAGHYRVLYPLGKGGMGEVLAAENLRTGGHVALKVLHAESKRKHTAIERFRREARAAASVVSPFVTQVYDVEDDDERGIVLVFELLKGESLVERLKRTGPIPFPELWTIVEAVWTGLADAHAAGIIHRDLKPSNVFLDFSSGTLGVKILDFGISKLPKEMTGESLTQAGQSLGTFSFMPPEQVGKAKSVDLRADIYACATLVFQALTGKLPFLAKNSVAMMELKLKHDPRSMFEASGTAFDERLEAFVRKGLARDPNARFQTAREAVAAWRSLRPEGALSLIPAANAPPDEESARPVYRQPAAERALAVTVPIPAANAAPALEHPTVRTVRAVPMISTSERSTTTTNRLPSIDTRPEAATPEPATRVTRPDAPASARSHPGAQHAVEPEPATVPLPAAGRAVAIIERAPRSAWVSLRWPLAGVALLALGFGCVTLILRFVR